MVIENYILIEEISNTYISKENKDEYIIICHVSTEFLSVSHKVIFKLFTVLFILCVDSLSFLN